MQLENYNITELIELRDKINNKIYSYVDGFIYICEVRSYGRNWTEEYYNTYNMMETLDHYGGDEGIVDVYTTNPNLDVSNYGDIFLIESKEDYLKYKSYVKEENFIKSIEEDWKRLDDWVEMYGDAIRNVFTGGHRPHNPFITKEELELEKEKFNKIVIDWKNPVSLKTEIDI